MYLYATEVVMNIHLKIVLCVTNRTVEKVVSAALQLLGKFL